MRGDGYCPVPWLDYVLLRLRLLLPLQTAPVCDRGFRTACNAYEAAKKKASELGESWDVLLELAHCELVHP